MKSITLNRWMPYAGFSGQIEMENEALAALRKGDSLTIVRSTTSGEFAVMAIRGAMAKVVKVLPTLGRARSYNFAINR